MPSTTLTKKYIDPFRVGLFFLVVTLIALTYTYILVELLGKSEFASMSQTNAPDILIFGASATVAFVVWKRFQDSTVKNILLFGTLFQSAVMVGAITINNYIAIYPITSTSFQEWYWVGWVIGIGVQPIVALGIAYSVKENLI